MLRDPSLCVVSSGPVPRLAGSCGGNLATPVQFLDRGLGRHRHGVLSPKWTTVALRRSIQPSHTRAIMGFYHPCPERPAAPRSHASNPRGQVVRLPRRDRRTARGCWPDSLPTTSALAARGRPRGVVIVPRPYHPSTSTFRRPDDGGWCWPRVGTAMRACYARRRTGVVRRRPVGRRCAPAHTAHAVVPRHRAVQGAARYTLNRRADIPSRRRCKRNHHGSRRLYAPGCRQRPTRHSSLWPAQRHPCAGSYACQPTLLPCPRFEEQVDRSW